jgi:hypothetical protein
MKAKNIKKRVKPSKAGTASPGAQSLLRLFIAQLDDAQQENDQTMRRVGELLEILAGNAQGISKKNSDQQPLNEIVSCLQAHDKLNQRLEHIRNGMETLAQQLKQRSVPTLKWTTLADQLPSSYTMEAEHRVYRQMFGTAHSKPLSSTESDDNIELF